MAVFNEGMPLIVNIKDIETVFLGYDYRYRKSADTYLHNIIKDVKKYKRKDNLVIVNMHWELNTSKHPLPIKPNSVVPLWMPELISSSAIILIVCKALKSTMGSISYTAWETMRLVPTQH